MDKNLNTIEKDDLLKTLRQISKEITEIRKEIVALKKRVQVLEGP